MKKKSIGFIGQLRSPIEIEMDRMEDYVFHFERLVCFYKLLIILDNSSCRNRNDYNVLLCQNHRKN